jgi:osmotically-inducible protein OsmY
LNVEDVTVRVDHGTVTLSGVVPSVFSKDAAFDAALDTAGVRAIINNLKVGS